MSVRTEINRISGAKDALVASIGNKGVAIPNGTKIDGLSPYVDAIATPKLQSKTVSPSTSSQTVKPDSSYNGLSQVTVNAMPSGNCTISGGALSGGSAVTPTVTLSNGSDTNMSNITAGAKDTTNYPYYFKVSGASSSGSSTVYRAAVTDTHTAGYIPNKSTTNVISAASKTVTVNAGSGSNYVGLKAGSCTVAGGGLTAGGGSVSGTGVNIDLTEKTDSSGGGYYVKVTGSGSVSRAAITDTHTAGYIPAKATTTVSSSTSLSSNTATKYYKIETETKTVTPGMSGSTVWPSEGKLLSSVSVKGDGNLIPAKIKKGETIFGVTGEYEGEGGSLGTDTCTVRLYVGTQAYWHPEDRVNVFYKAYENGRWRVKYIETDATASNYVTLNNIICGSEFFVYTEMCSYIDPGEYELFSDEYRHCLICPNAKGQTITINMWEAS